MVADSIHMNLSTHSSKRFMSEPSGPESRKEGQVANGTRKETLNELERQQPRKQTNEHGLGMMRYLRDVNASEAFAVGGDELTAASNKEIAMRLNLKAWEVRFEQLSTTSGKKVGKGKAQEDARSPRAKEE